MCPHERKIRLIMTTLGRHAATHLNPELLILQLKLFKRKYGLTYGKLAEKIGVNGLQLSGWIRGKRTPTYTNQLKLLNYLEAHS